MNQNQGPQRGLPGPAMSMVAPPMLSLMLFLSVFYLPVFGVAFSFFAPLPLVYYFFTHGRQSWFTAVIAISVIIGAILGFRAGLLYMAGYGVVAVFLSEMILRREVMTRTVGTAATAGAAATALLLLVSSPVPVSELYGELLTMSRTMVEEALTAGQADMPPEQEQFIQDNARNIATWFVKLIPASMAVGFMILSAVNFISYRRIQQRYTFLPEADPTPVKFWVPPEKLVFVFIIGLALALLDIGTFSTIGANLLVISLAVYAFAGVAVVEFLMDRFRVPFLFRMLAYTLVIIQPFFLSMVAGLGLFDLWLDFRKIRKPEEEGKNDDTDNKEE